MKASASCIEQASHCTTLAGAAGAHRCRKGLEDVPPVQLRWAGHASPHDGACALEVLFIDRYTLEAIRQEGHLDFQLGQQVVALEGVNRCDQSCLREWQAHMDLLAPPIPCKA